MNNIRFSSFKSCEFKLASSQWLPCHTKHLINSVAYSFLLGKEFAFEQRINGFRVT